MRAVLVRLHRWLGLATAAFLFVAGLTGAVIAWEHELDGALNPRWARAAGSGRTGLELAAGLEAADPRLQVTYAPLATPPGAAWVAMVAPRLDPATGRPFDLDFDQVALDPGSGEVQARRRWGRLSLRREDLLPGLYKLHYSLHLPGTWGVLLMGAAGIAWTIGSLAALGAAFPRLSAWRRSLRFRLGAGGAKALFDLHRSGGVWLWAGLLAVAVTSVGLNLGDTLVRPLLARVARVTPEPAEPPPGPSLPRTALVAAACREADRLGLGRPAGAFWQAPGSGLFAVGFFPPGQEHGDGGLGNPWLYLDARTGAPAGARIPGRGTGADLYLQAQFPVHSGRVLGLPGRILVSFLGLAAAGLAATGVLLWGRRRMPGSIQRPGQAHAGQRQGGQDR